MMALRLLIDAAALIGFFWFLWELASVFGWVW